MILEELAHTFRLNRGVRGTDRDLIIRLMDACAGRVTTCTVDGVPSFRRCYIKTS
jgi:hypothetical protein